MKKLLTLFILTLLLLPTVSSATYNPSGGSSYRLQTSIGSSNTTIRLSSFKEPVSNIPYTMTFLNSDLECGTIAPGLSTSEFISFTGITQNADGTATLTGVSRGLSRSYPYTASTTHQQPHPGQSTFIMSDAPCLFSQYAVKQNNEAITGSWTAPTPTSASGIANKAYVDSVAGGIATLDKVTVAGTAGETFATGTVIYLKTSDARWYKADSGTPGTIVDSIVGIAQGAGAAGVAISGGALLFGLDTTQIGLTAGANYFVGTNGATTTSTTTRALGKARSTTGLYVDTHMTGVQLGANNTFTGQNIFSATTTFNGYVAGNVASTSIKVFTASTTWNRPANLRYLIVEAVGGGGAGGGKDAETYECGAAGGAGGYSKEIIATSSLGATEVVTVGFRGVGALSAAGGNGANTSFGSHVTANGGAGGASDGTAGAIQAGGAGGTASGGDINITGQAGGYCVADSTGAVSGGSGGNSILGAGGIGGVLNDADANGTAPVAGTIYGGGGSGVANANASGASTGADGANGVVIVYEIF